MNLGGPDNLSASNGGSTRAPDGRAPAAGVGAGGVVPRAVASEVDVTDDRICVDVAPVGSPDVAAARAERRTRRASTNRAFRAIKAEHSGNLTLVERVAERLTYWASSTPMLVAHVVWFGVWIAWNTGLLGLRPFDPFPFGLLTMVVSLEAIFLSIFVLLSQNREASIAELREELALQVNLRMEEEVTKTLQLVAGLYTRLGQKLGDDADLREMLQPLDAKRIEQELIEQIRQSSASGRGRAKREKASTQG